MITTTRLLDKPPVCFYVAGIVMCLNPRQTLDSIRKLPPGGLQEEREKRQPQHSKAHVYSPTFIELRIRALFCGMLQVLRSETFQDLVVQCNRG
jgi:hypothetical protein